MRGIFDLETTMALIFFLLLGVRILMSVLKHAEAEKRMYATMELERLMAIEQEEAAREARLNRQSKMRGS